jgi:EAL domain-containing protein (putative c-di-GMP-specific phosphodiesterase class I)
MAINTVVLVHGAFADGSCWAKVIPLLTARGLKAIAVQNPLSSLADDVAAAHRVIDQQDGPVLLVGHSWGGAVITEAGNHAQVKGLVYIAAGAPDSGQSLRDNLLAARFTRILKEHGIAPERLEVDVTEAAFVADLDNARAVLGALRDTGVRIALDNFGTGYSSLYHLRNFRLDKVKIDRSFIQAMTSERESAGIVQALIGLGHGLGLTVAAEGIQALDQEDALLGTGCEEGQGDLLGGPLDAAAATALVRTAKAGTLG